MNLKQYKEALDKFIEENPEALELDPTQGGSKYNGFDVLGLNLGASVSNSLREVNIRTIKDLSEAENSQIRNIHNLGKFGSMTLARSLAQIIVEMRG